MHISHQEEMDKYWFKCNSDVRKGFTFACMLMFVMSLKDIILNTNEKLLKFGIYNLIATIIAFFIVYLSFQPKFGVKFVFYAIVLL